MNEKMKLRDIETAKLVAEIYQKDKNLMQAAKDILALMGRRMDKAGKRNTYTRMRCPYVEVSCVDGLNGVEFVYTLLGDEFRERYFARFPMRFLDPNDDLFVQWMNNPVDFSKVSVRDYSKTEDDVLEERKQAFLEELNDLCEEHGFCLDAYGDIFICECTRRYIDIGDGYLTTENI